MKLTAVVLSKNNQAIIGRCLRSLKFVQEIILVDDFSTDKTIPLAKKFKAKILRRKLNDNWAAQRNFGLRQASGDWVIFVDSDETVSPLLAIEIKSAIMANSSSGFYLRREDEFLGRRLKHGETGNVRLLRLAKRGSGFWHRPVHEVWRVKGKIRQLKQPLIHQRDLSIADFIDRTNHYTDIDAQEQIRERKPFTYLHLFTKPAAKFLINY